MVSRRCVVPCMVFLAILLTLPTTVEAQQNRRGQQRQSGQQEALPADSLRQLLLRLQARLDSLEALLQAVPGGLPETARGRVRARAGQTGTRPMNELAALRAAARQRVAEAPPRDTVVGPSVLKSRNLNDFNPEISVTGDVRIVARDPGPQRNNVDLREFSVQFQAPLDPFSNAKLTFSTGEEGFGLEEAYAYWTGLPGGLRLDVGRFRQAIGELNRWHLHALPESEYGLAIREYFGDDGLVGDGLGLYGTLPVQTPGGGVHEVWAQVTRAGNEALFEEGDRLSYMGHVNNFWQMSDATYAQIGISALWGKNPDADLESSVLGGDFRISWVPPGRSLHRSFTLRGEGFRVNRKRDGEEEDFLGGYLSGTLQLSQRWNLGGRVDYVEPFTLPGEHIWALVPQITYWQSEWVFLRGELGWQSAPGPDGRHRHESVFGIQIVWSLGPHKHETY